MVTHHLLGKSRFINSTIIQKFLFLLTTIILLTYYKTEDKAINNREINKVVTVDEFKNNLAQDNI